MINAVVFDAYGTLFDVHSVMETCEQMFPGQGQAISQIWRQKQLEYTWLRALMKRYADFWEVNRDSLTYTLRSLNLQFDSSAVEHLLQEYLHLKAYPEVKQALQQLRPRKLAILSNGTGYMLQSLVSSAGMEGILDDIISVDDLGTYKPAPSVYQLAVTKLQVSKEHILFVSSNGWDVAGSKAFGFRVGWINRTDKVREKLGLEPDYEVKDLLQLVKAVRG